MGKYKQWLHHQEIGRRLREQISILEQERGRVQNMAPAHPTSLPELDNPIIAALQAYTRAGNKLSAVDVIKAAMPDLGPDPVKTTPAPGSPAITNRPPAAPSPSTRPAAQASATGEAVTATLMSRAEQMPSDPLHQMQSLSRAQDQGATAPKNAAAADSVNDWWQRHRQDGE